MRKNTIGSSVPSWGYIIAFGMIYTLSMGRASRSWEMSAYVLCIVGNAEERRNTSHGERCQWKETQDKSLVVIRGRRKIRLQVPERVSWAEEYTKQVQLKRTRQVVET
tara:strand:- start:1789 stop:2112 length:324 start_codon:yes stop_codon:yes gene_type:complete